MRADRLIDLDDDAFARLAPLSRGLLRVTVTAISSPPETSTGGQP
jgi:rare lipoprotein A (peptidoglycan hydrolase)